jgi:hypothetical protein
MVRQLSMVRLVKTTKERWRRPLIDNCSFIDAYIKSKCNNCHSYNDLQEVYRVLKVPGGPWQDDIVRLSSATIDKPHHSSGAAHKVALTFW